MEKRELLYEGKAKKIFKTDNQDILWVYYKDDATAFNNQKRGQIKNKGVINNKITNYFMNFLEKNKVSTHFIKEISDRETFVKRLEIIPLEVIVRNVVAGSFSKRYGICEGEMLKKSTIEFSYKNDELGDPFISEYSAVALELASEKEIEVVKKLSFEINDLLKGHLKIFNIKLVDFKLEFGKVKNGEIILGDEVSPDTCRFWDIKTHEKLDKDRFRNDLGNVEDAYNEILNRLKI
ncbi:MAG: phosphoribosylaminoimidazolesuccinocarboxamide synthase [Clostridiales bacterium]|jgi:phosphoribosylaminoimidazole-succinocarboxamide synthase|nr:phosphoribosylaminoimidazolesuccinocarboxamide synthase [Clostridiales bacterium]